MELFVPSLIVLLLSALVCFFILPNLAPYVLGGLAIAMFGLGFWQHYTMFPYEYRDSLLTDLIRDYAGFFMSSAVIIASTAVILAMYGGNTPSGEAMAMEIPAMPEMPAMPAIPEISEMPTMPEMPAMFGLNNANKPANNANKSNNNVNKPANNANKPNNNANKKNNLASTSFKVV